MANTTRIVPLFIAIMSMSLFFALVPNVLAYVSGPTQSGQLYDEVWSPGHLCANYVTAARYDAKGGDNNPYFFPGIMSHSDTSGPVLFYYVTDLKITVTGMKPDGSPIGGLEFADQAWLDSPHDSGQSWYDLLSFLYDAITGLAPYGASELLKYGQQSTESGWRYNETATWAEWRWNGWIFTRASDKGLQFRFSLHCDPNLTGIYTLNVKYHVEICALTANLNYILAVNKDFYETITYYFGSPKLTISATPDGTTNPAPGTYTYDYGSPVTVTASAYTGYAFDCWLLDGATVFENPINVTMDSDHTLEAHFSEPACAMKTRTDGYFYVPNVATDLLKIEMLFNNSNLVGDQKGGASPYGQIKVYPDGLVDIEDLYFIADKFGLVEGQSGWDYMADVVPDTVIDITDLYAASLNYGYYGTYPQLNLTGITVTFNTGGQKTPDSNGFVTIPQGATNFTVKRNSTPIGAMVIFW